MSILVKALKCATKRLRAFHDFTFELAISTFSASAPTPGPTRPPRPHACTYVMLRKPMTLNARERNGATNLEALHLQFPSPPGMSHLPLCSARPHGNR